MDIADQILYEDNHLIALNKLPGQIVQADKTGDTCLADMVKAFLKCRDSKPGNVFCGVIHRLDRPVSGVVIFAKTGKALSRMNELVKSRDFHKSYLAVVKTPPPQPQGHLEDYLLRNEKQNKSFVVGDSRKGEAKLDTEGMQTMRTLGNNMAWLLQKIHADGPTAPNREERHTFMNFIR